VNTYHLDYETFSRADLRNVGTFRYAADPSTEILCMALSCNGEDPVVWRCDNKWRSPQELVRFNEYMDEIEDGNCVIYAHNAMFEIAISEHLWLKTFKRSKPAYNQWRCTMAMAKKLALPNSLEKLAEYLRLAERKDVRGHGLIRTFSIPQKPKKVRGVGQGSEFRILPTDQPEKFQQFVDYCIQDVRTECAIHTKLNPFLLRGTTLDTFQADIMLNVRGVPVNVDGLHQASALIDKVTTVSLEEFRQITGFEVTQKKVLLKWLQERGYPHDNLRAATVDGELGEDTDEDEDDEITASDEGLTDEARQALQLAKNTSYNSIKKIKKMLEVVGPHDNRLRGLHDWHGPTTGRWASKLVQIQNFKRPTYRHTERAYRDICGGITPDVLRLVHGEPLDILGNCIRHFIDMGLPMLNADYSAIEARNVMWLADEEHALQDYRNGVDRYVKMAAVIFSDTYEAIRARVKAGDKDAAMQRFIGKQAVLACGYQTSAVGFIRACQLQGVTPPTELAERAVAAFREQHPKLVRFWYATEAACKNAVLHPGQDFKIGGKCSAFVRTINGLTFLFVKLPSGRVLSYPEPRIAGENEFVMRGAKGKEYQHQLKPGGVHFYGLPKPKPGQTSSSKKWGRVETYGGKLVENITQAVSADLMGAGLVRCEQHGYKVVALIHDEALAELHPGQTLEEFQKLLTTLPEWAKGLPLESEGSVIKFYTK
jgi:DNA polymerase